jgi:DNA-binding CsgD family transcriptional regulator
VWTTEQAVEQYPLVAGWVQSQPELAGDEVFVVPVRSAGTVVGALLVTLPQRTERSWRLRLLLDSAAIALGLWSRGVLAQARADAGRPRKSVAALTERQSSIVAGIRTGRSNREIAEDLQVSVGTVKADLSQLYRLFGVSDREALVALVDSVR